MRVWVKICGLTDADGVDAAIAAGADAIGFVFASSPRQISADAALALKHRIAGRCATVAVMRHPSRALVDQVLATLRPDFLQTELSDFADLTDVTNCQWLPVLRDPSAADLGRLPPRALVEGRQSGKGELADWHAARLVAQRTEVVLAGGLDPDNVGAAIGQVRPFGVDVSSGVESAPGRKDAEKIHAFIAAARAADARPHQHEELPT